MDLGGQKIFYFDFKTTKAGRFDFSNISQGIQIMPALKPVGSDANSFASSEHRI